MAGTSRTIRVRFDGSAAGLAREAKKAEQALSSFQKKTHLVTAGLTAAGLGAPALLAGASLLFAGLAAVGLATSEKVQAAFSRMGREVKTGFQQDTAVLAPVAERVASKVGRAFQSIRPLLRATFADIGPQIETVTDGLLGLVTKALPGLSRAARASLPAVQGLSGFLQKTGQGVSDFFDRLTSAAPNAGKIFSSLGDLVGRLLPVLGRLLAVAANFASGALPVLVGAITALLKVLDGVLTFLDPIAPVLGAVAAAALVTAGAFKAWTGITAIVGAFSNVVQTAGGKAGAFITQLTGSAAAGEKVAGATGRVSAALSKVGASLPLIGAALVALGLGYDSMRSKADEFARSALDGSISFQGAVNAERNQIENLTLAHAPWLTASMQATKVALADAEARKRVTAEITSQLGQMGPLERAQAQAALAMGKYQDAVRDFGAGSPEAQAAQRDLAAATNTAEDAQKAASDATKDYTDALRAQTDQISGILDASLAYDEQLAAQKDAEHEAAAAVRDHGAGSAEAKEAMLRLQEQYVGTAGAARDKAAADHASQGEQASAAAGSDAYRLKLSELANQQNGPGRTAALGLIDRLGDTELKAFDAANATSGFKTQVVTLPSGRTVTIIADTDAAQRRLDAIRASLAGFRTSATVRLNVVENRTVVTGSVQGRAAGGAIYGPGSGTSDTAGLFALSNGEHVWTAAEVRRAGGHRAMEQMRSQFRGMAGGGPVGPASGGAAPLVQVFIDGQEFRGMIDTRISESGRQTRRAVGAGAGRGA